VKRRAAGLVFGVMVLGGLIVGGGVLAAGDRHEPSESSPGITWTDGHVRVEVANGGGVPRMARAATGLLRTAGFDVVDFGNASSAESGKPSVVIDRVGRGEVAQAVAATLGIDNVLSDPDPNLYVDVSVVLGPEWTVDATLDVDDQSGSRPGWDLRSWFGR
jgi:LytR cell envelope-related transcriptional attenuator